MERETKKVTSTEFLPLKVYPFTLELYFSNSSLQYYDTEFTLWDRFEIQGELTMKELMDHFQVSNNFLLSPASFLKIMYINLNEFLFASLEDVDL